MEFYYNCFYFFNRILRLWEIQWIAQSHIVSKGWCCFSPGSLTLHSIFHLLYYIVSIESKQEILWTHWFKSKCWVYHTVFLFEGCVCGKRRQFALVSPEIGKRPSPSTPWKKVSQSWLMPFLCVTGSGRVN